MEAVSRHVCMPQSPHASEKWTTLSGTGERASIFDLHNTMSNSQLGIHRGSAWRNMAGACFSSPRHLLSETGLSFNEKAAAASFRQSGAVLNMTLNIEAALIL